MDPHAIPAGPVSAWHFVVEWEDGAVRGYREDLGPNALAALDRARWAPQRKLDLHRARVADLAQLVVPFTIESARSGLTRVLVIHGKGLHSPGRIGVLSGALVELLTEPPLATFVRAFRTAPLVLGGTGALCAELVGSRRGPRSENVA